ncbi:lycopene cyclase domain-containing protein [Catellatospora sp. NPDC049133]|jgi:lycopene cyclase domain-containing protein|uniref:lycopene cyclase domain-containing protein n=1 Tax=Catellatospora sp. NPDC049133 TaxID=3155499 RepID=UPI0033DEF2F9
MDALRYLLILAACVAVTLPLEAVLGARVYRQPRRLVSTLAPVVAVFVTWDLIATARGHWWFSDRYTTGVTVAGLPWEEWLFFLVVPLCALLTFEVLGQGPRLLRRAERAGLLGRARRPGRSLPGAAVPSGPAGSPVQPEATGGRRGR